MTKELFVKLKEVEGFYHRPDWYRPLAYGENIYLDTTYLLPGVELTMGSQKYLEGTERLERVIYTMTGTIEVTHSGETTVVSPHTAFIVPMVPASPFVIKNNGREVASYLVCYSPPPHPELKITRREEMLARYRANNRAVKSPEEMEQLIANPCPTTEG